MIATAQEANQLQGEDLDLVHVGVELAGLRIAPFKSALRQLGLFNPHARAFIELGVVGVHLAGPRF